MLLPLLLHFGLHFAQITPKSRCEADFARSRSAARFSLRGAEVIFGARKKRGCFARSAL
jgi:hypothetical protein